ncbi:MAG TPA: hypothetical protein VL475_00255, partial [Planctomycetaceae bacterium]|nr:hypothetical protein [Planctomycetaceae bacterium]
MPLPKPAFFQSDRLPRWRSALAGGWIWLRLKFRHNPGFVTAAAAGSVGLVLTAILLLNGRFGIPGASKTAEPEIADDAELGEPEGTPSNHLVSAFPADAACNAREGGGTIGGVASRGSKVAPKEEDLWNDEEPAERATGTVAARETGAGTSPRFKRTPFDEEPLEADKQDAQPRPIDRAEPLLVANEPPDNSTGISEPTGSADETSKVEEEDEPAPQKSLTGRIAEPANEKEPEESHGFLSDDEPLTSHEEEQPATSRAPATRAKPPART